MNDYKYLIREGKMEAVNFTDRRDGKRFLAKTGAMVFFNGGDSYGQIIDFSLGGLSFLATHRENSHSAKTSFSLNGDADLVYAKKNLTIGRVTAKVISYSLTSSVHHSGIIIKKKRCSLQFKELSREQLSLLKRFQLSCCVQDEESGMWNTELGTPGFKEVGSVEVGLQPR
jgi:hypothetical protein